MPEEWEVKVKRPVGASSNCINFFTFSARKLGNIWSIAEVIELTRPHLMLSVPHLASKQRIVQILLIDRGHGAVAWAYQG